MIEYIAAGLLILLYCWSLWESVLAHRATEVARAELFKAEDKIKIQKDFIREHLDICDGVDFDIQRKPRPLHIVPDNKGGS